MNGNAVSANEVLLGYYGSSAVTVQNQGTLTANNLYLGNGTSYHFLSSDAVGILGVYGGSSATTATVGNITGTANVYNGSTLNLGANLSLSGTLAVEDQGSVLNMNGYAVNANQVDLGYYDGNAVTVENRGARSRRPACWSATRRLT